MGMSTHVVGFRPADDLWKQMKDIWEKCEAAGLEVPEKVQEFFDYIPPEDDSPGMEVEIEEATTKYSAESRKGLEIDIEKLPKGLRYIRFYNSW